MSKTSPAVVFSPPVIAAATFHCAVLSLLLIEMEPLDFDVPEGLYMGEYHTSAP